MHKISNKMILNLFIFLFIHLIIGRAESKRRIRCVDKKKNISSSCIVEEIDETPWSTNLQKTAPLPKLVSAEFYLHKSKSSQKFYLNVTWEQRVSRLKLVEGYFMEIKLHDLYGPGIKKKFHIKPGHFQKGTVYFTYDRFGRLGHELIHPNEVYTITLHALPMYGDHYAIPNPGHDIVAKVPECPSNEELQLYSMRVCPLTRYYDPQIFEYEDDFPPASQVSDKTNDKSFLVGIILLCVSMASFLSILIYLYLNWDSLKDRNKLCRNGYESSAQTDNHIAPASDHILVLVPTAGVVGRPPEWTFTQRFASLLLQILGDDGVKVDCNLWNINKSPFDARLWLCDVITRNQRPLLLVMVNCEIGSTVKSTDAYREAMKYVTGSDVTHNYEFVTINFGDDVIDDVVGTSYSLPRDVVKLMHRITKQTPDDSTASELSQLALNVMTSPSTTFV